MRDRTPKMLDFLELGFAGAERIQQAQKLSDVLELVNVAVRGEQVKYLFEGRV
jgi:hypothetical protein